MYKADGTSKHAGRSRLLRRARSATSAASRLTIVSMAMALVAAACGGETQPGIGVDTIPEVITTTSTIPPETTTTIDFNRPINQGTSPLVAEANIAELAQLVDEIRGQTNSVSDQMNRLAAFIGMANPVNAQILDFSTSIKPLPDEPELTVESTVDFRVPQTREVVERFVKDEMRSRGWNKANESTQLVEGIDTTTLTFLEVGAMPEETELVAAISGVPGATSVRYSYRQRVTEEDEAFERLQAWQSNLQVPRNASVIETRVETADDIGTIVVVYQLTAETAAEARETVTGLQREEDFTVGTSQESGTNTAPLLLVDENNRELLLDFMASGEPDVVEMTVSNSFGLEPVD